ncbi:hypothetical protein ACFYO7_31750 [Nocardia salmonicida]|uniref:hypothetical protein n=1 Tax=Nocardia salmonicida TaxID=53431 RepID=UPI0036AB8C15
MELPAMLRMDSTARTTPGYSDRQWAVREAVLKWAHNEDLLDNPVPVLAAFVVGASVDWPGESLTEDEVVRASLWLTRMRLFNSIDLDPAFGHRATLYRPRITAEGIRVARGPGGVRGVSWPGIIPIGTSGRPTPPPPPRDLTPPPQPTG